MHCLPRFAQNEYKMAALALAIARRPALDKWFGFCLRFLFVSGVDLSFCFNARQPVCEECGEEKGPNGK